MLINIDSNNTENLIVKSISKHRKASFLDLVDCEAELKNFYWLTEEDSFIIVQTEKKTSVASEKDVKIEVYHPITHEKVELTLCQNLKANLYIPVDLSERTESLYRRMMDQGYDPFDYYDKFYREICTPYNSENGTDVLLDDSEEFIYISVVN